MNTPKRLYRSRRNSVLTGVAGGIGEYFNIDPTFVRLLFVLLTLAGASGLIIYIVMAIVVPLEPMNLTYSETTFETHTAGEPGVPTDERPESSQDNVIQTYSDRKFSKFSSDGNLIAGITLIILGILFLLDKFIPDVDFGDLWPILLIIGGIFILFRSFSDNYQSK